MIRLRKTLALLLLLPSAPGFAAERLGSFAVDPGQVSVAGISSGAFMANQLHIAHSADIMGAAIIAGGLYGCAALQATRDGVLSLASQAAGPCMQTPFLLEEVSFYADLVKTLAAEGQIDPPSNLSHSRLYIFTGGSDIVVDSATVERGRDVYVALGVPAGSIVFEDKTGPAAKAGHSWVTKNFGGACTANAEPFIDDCRYDQAGAELKAIYGAGLQPPTVRQSGYIVAFDQREFAPAKAAKPNGLADVGFLFVPQQCTGGAAQPCRLQVVLHGCEQSAETLGDKFYTKIGVNEWADANGIVVLYPQAHATTLAELPPGSPLTALYEANPNGCWNWWGYSDDERYLTKNGVQVDAIWKMVQRIEGN